MLVISLVYFIFFLKIFTFISVISFVRTIIFLSSRSIIHNHSNVHADISIISASFKAEALNVRLRIWNKMDDFNFGWRSLDGLIQFRLTSSLKLYGTLHKSVFIKVTHTKWRVLSLLKLLRLIFHHFEILSLVTLY